MRQSLHSLKRLFRYLRPYRKSFYLALTLAFFTVVANAALPYISGLPTTRIQENVTAGEAVDFPYIFKTLLIFLGASAVYIVSQLIAGFAMTNAVQNGMEDLRQDISKKINRLPVSFFDKHQLGDLLSRVTNDVDAVSGALQQSFIAIVSALLGLIMAISMMFYINVKMALFSMLMIPASILISQGIVKISQKYFRGQQDALGDLNGFVQENLTGFSVLKLYGQEKQTLAGFEKVNHRLNYFGFRSAFISGLMMPLVQLTAYSAYIGVAVVGSLYVIQGILLVGQLQAFVQYVWQVSQPLGNITQLSSVLQSASAATNRVFAILDEAEEVVNPDEVPLPKEVAGNVTFRHVDFAYDPAKPLIEDLNFEVKAGQMVAIVGPTGAGKTTLINLLMRFYDVTGGAIEIDGLDTKQLARSDVRSLFGMVLQDAWLYHDTILENIRFGNFSADDYQVIDAAKTANVDHFIRTMPDGYEMEINEEGSNISLGQKQLMTIARAVIADPKILILDEATSSVDTRLEALIQKAMERVMRGRTSFVIAHRLSTIRDADLILVMNRGKIIEQGTHESLLAKGGFYEELYHSQFQEEE
ncbi:ABC transporter ATP-binding protein [Enterococcus nangangensis]